MIDANISEGDILVLDKSLDATHGKIIIAVVDGEFTVKTLYNKDGIVKLVPANPDYPEIVLKNEQELNGGYGISTLKDIRRFYLIYQNYTPISHAVRGESKLILSPVFTIH